MDEVTFSNVAPIIAVGDLDRALRRYRKLGFSARAYEGPDRYGFVERDGVELHLSESPQHDRTRDGSEIYLYVSDADALYVAWLSSGVKGRFIPPHDTPLRPAGVRLRRPRRNRAPHRVAASARLTREGLRGSPVPRPPLLRVDVPCLRPVQRGSVL